MVHYLQTAVARMLKKEMSAMSRSITNKSLRTGVIMLTNAMCCILCCVHCSFPADLLLQLNKSISTRREKGVWVLVEEISARQPDSIHLQNLLSAWNHLSQERPIDEQCQFNMFILTLAHCCASRVLTMMYDVSVFLSCLGFVRVLKSVTHVRQRLPVSTLAAVIEYLSERSGTVHNSQSSISPYMC